MLTFIYRFIEGYLKNICEQRNNIFFYCKYKESPLFEFLNFSSTCCDICGKLILCLKVAARRSEQTGNFLSNTDMTFVTKSNILNPEKQKKNKKLNYRCFKALQGEYQSQIGFCSIMNLNSRFFSLSFLNTVFLMLITLSQEPSLSLSCGTVYP